METDRLRRLLDSVRDGAASVDEAVEQLRLLPYEDLGYARVDHHRSLRTGFPEVIYCPGKTTEQIVEIAERLRRKGSKVLATRADPAVGRELLERFDEGFYHDKARVVVLQPDREAEAPAAQRGFDTLRSQPQPRPSTEPRPSDVRGEEAPTPVGTILVVSAGTADQAVAEEAAVVAAEMGSPVERLYDVGVAGLHRLLDQRERLFAANVIIVVAGMEGALASVVGGLVRRPVIAVPTSVGYGASFGGLSALLTMLNSCAAGVSVMNIDNGFGAGYFAHIVNCGK